MATVFVKLEGPKYYYRTVDSGGESAVWTTTTRVEDAEGNPPVDPPKSVEHKKVVAESSAPIADPVVNPKVEPGIPQASFGGDTFGYAYRDNIIGAEMPSLGVKSLFNEYSMFRYDSAAGDFNRLYDSAKGLLGPTPIISRNPTAHNIIQWSLENSTGYNSFGSTPYSYSDFLWCKYYGHIPNNYMVTLRRYPVPMTDNVKTHDGSNMPPVAQAVTWMGEETENPLSGLMKFTAGLMWKEIEAKVQEISGNERGFENEPFSAVPGGKLIGGVQAFLNPREYSGQAQSESDYAKEVYGSDGPYANKVYGPVNVVNKTMARDQGLHFEQELSIKFHYKLNSEAGINPKMAMLDIIGNMLTLCYNNAKFWGGAIRYFPQHPNKPMLGDQKAFYSGDVGGYIDSVMTGLKKITGGEDGKSGFMDTFSKIIQSPESALQAIKELALGAGKMAMGKFAQKDRPQIIAMRSLLTGDPVGEWHLVIGNPMNPIAMIGNLICTDIEMTTSDILGADDFPTEIMFTVKLNHGKPRDKGDIESMFNLGNGRLYYGINDNAVFSSTHNSMMDTSGPKGEAANNTESGSKGFRELTPAQVAANQNASANLKIPGKSMWGNKFNPGELQIAKTWAGDASKSLSGTTKP